MRYHLTGISEEKREIYMVADEDDTLTITINAADAAWSGKEGDIEVLNAPSGATVYYMADDGTRTYINYRFEDGEAKAV